MNLAAASLRRSTFVLFAAVVLALAGVGAGFRLGQLEDATFTIKTATVTTLYPGATALEVEQEVTDRIESAIQRMAQVDTVRSISRAGLSIVYADMKEQYPSSEFPQIWDELRRAVGDAQRNLPPGAGPSLVQDDFGDVFGILLAITGDGFSPAEVREHAEDVRRELLRVPDVARIILWGDQQEVVYLEIPQARLAELGLAPQTIPGILSDQNLVLEAGMLDAGADRIALRPGDGFQSVAEIADVLLPSPGGSPIRLGDIATISRGYRDPPRNLMRFDGQPAIALGISAVDGANVVEMGDGVAAALERLRADLPVGIEFGVVAFQAETVRESVSAFMANLIAAVVIVVLTLLAFLGLRTGLVIGATLLLTMLSTLVFMLLWGIDLQRVSIGAMIIALGMLVDNAIVVAEGIQVRQEKGQPAKEAAAETVARTAWPLLGATLVAIIAFLAIYISDNNTGEYMRSLFEVLAGSLLLSWILAVTVTPVLCVKFLRVKKPAKGADGAEGMLQRRYRDSLHWVLARPRPAMWVVLVVAALGIVGVTQLDREFFPPSTLNQFLVDYWLPEGRSIHAVSDDLREMDAMLLADPRVRSTAAFIGAGPPRFQLTLPPELPSSNYGQIVVRVDDFREIPGFLDELRDKLAEEYPDARTRVRPIPLGASTRFGVEARFQGPDPGVLRALAEQAKEVLERHPKSYAVGDNWGSRTLALVPQFDQDRARAAMVSRSDLASSMRGAFDGLPVGLYREDDLLLPILARLPEPERRNLENIGQLLVWSSATGRGFPLSQVASPVVKRWEDPVIWRRDRQREIIAESDSRGVNATQFTEMIAGALEAIEVPPGYSFEWGGVRESSRDAQAGLAGGIPVSALLMVVIVMGLFNAVRQTAIIFLLVPLAAVGVALGLLVAGLPLGFTALLGLMSLAGMVIKNNIVLIDEADTQLASGKARYTGLVDSAVSRMRPVIMASLTTILGMIPLAFDPFFNGMAVAIMGGLMAASLLTLYVAPLLYAWFLGIKRTES